MKRLLTFLAVFLLTVVSVQAGPQPVTLHADKTTAWRGQRLPFSIELRTSGSFAGTPVFDLPELPGTLLLKIGSPVLGSGEDNGESWISQTHEFVLFSQRVGTIDLPPFAVRFSSRQGFTGPANQQQGQVSGFTVHIQAPPGSDRNGFLIATPALDVKETWDPQPGPTQAGALFKRTIVQQAPQVAGMALAPALRAAPEGVRVYAGDAETKDALERGEFLGQRRETLTYLLQQPGSLTLPALAYTWWNTDTEQLQTTTLPAVTFAVAPNPVASALANRSKTGPSWFLALMVIAFILLAAVGIFRRKELVGLWKKVSGALHLAEKAAAKELLSACDAGNARAAERAWMRWRSCRPPGFQPGSELAAAIFGLQRSLYGPAETQLSWQGEDLGRAFTDILQTKKAASAHPAPASLPALNP